MATAAYTGVVSQKSMRRAALDLAVRRSGPEELLRLAWASCLLRRVAIGALTEQLRPCGGSSPRAAAALGCIALALGTAEELQGMVEANVILSAAALLPHSPAARLLLQLIYARYIGDDESLEADQTSALPAWQRAVEAIPELGVLARPASVAVRVLMHAPGRPDITVLEPNGDERQLVLGLWVPGGFRETELPTTGPPGRLANWYSRAMLALVLVTRAERVLLLGLGGGGLARAVLAEVPGARVVAVERHPAVVEAAEVWFGLGPGLEVHIAEACQWVGQCSEQYDAVLVDLYSEGKTPELAGLFERLAGRVAPGGLVCCNCGDQLGGACEGLAQAVGSPVLLGCAGQDCGNLVAVAFAGGAGLDELCTPGRLLGVRPGLEVGTVLQELAVASERCAGIGLGSLADRMVYIDIELNERS